MKENVDIDIRLTAKTRELIPFIASPHKKWGAHLLIFLWEWITKERLYSEIPSALSDLPPTLWQKLPILTELKIFKKLTPWNKYPDEPLVYLYSADDIGLGADFFNKEKAIMRAAGEAIERSLWYTSDEFYKNKSKVFSIEDAPKNVLPINTLVGFSNKQREQFPEIFFNEQTNFRWVKGIDLLNKKGIWCPVQLVSAEYTLQKNRGGEPMLRWPVTTGAATATTKTTAIVKGLIEIIERDAFMINYLNKLNPPHINLFQLAKQNEKISFLVEQFKKYDLEVYALEMLSDFDIPICTVLIVDRTGKGPALTVGAGASFSPFDALLSAVNEAMSVRYTFKQRFQEKHSEDKMAFGHHDRIIYWAKHPRQIDSLSFFMKTNSNKTVFQYDIDKNINSKTALKKLEEDLKRKGYDAYAVEISDSHTKKIGFYTYQTIIPQLQPLHLEERIPYFSGERLYTVPITKGCRPIKSINVEPHPFP